MIDHVSIGVRDIARTKRFYDAALKPLGYKCLSEGEGSLGYGRTQLRSGSPARIARCPPIQNRVCIFALSRPRRAALRHSTRRH